MHIIQKGKRRTMNNVIVTLILLCPSIAFSAPDKCVNFAMESPVSAHEFVMFKTNLGLKDVFQKSAYRHYFDDGENLAFIDYSYESNQYVLHMQSTIDKDIEIKAGLLDEMSKMLILTAKTRIGVKSGRNFINGNNSFFSTELSRMSDVKKISQKTLRAK